MALTIAEAAKRTIYMQGAFNFCYYEDELKSFFEKGYGHLEGFDCKIVNVFGANRFIIIVNKNWFDNKTNNEYIAKPRLVRGASESFDFQLIPATSKLFAIYYLDLYSYCLQLEKDRNEWFGKTYWGIKVDEADETFTFSGGNTIKFPLLRITGSESLVQKAGEFNQLPRVRFKGQPMLTRDKKKLEVS